MIHKAPSLAVVLLLMQGCTAKTVPASDHFSGSRFHNRGNAPGYSLWDEIRIGWELRTKRKNWPARFETKPYAVPAEPMLKGIRVLWVGHSTTLIQTPHLSVLTDPILFDSIGPSVFGLNTVTNCLAFRLRVSQSAGPGSISRGSHRPMTRTTGFSGS